MKQSKLVSLIKEVVRNEVKKQITNILISETNIPTKKLVVKKGIIGDNTEIDCFTIINPKKYELEKNIEVIANSDCYYRSEVELESNACIKRFALTNPIWFELTKRGV